MEMEVAGRWRHQWAGAAEYGKVVDGVGGVTRMARALEVRTSSGPGARVRVARAAFHASGPVSTSYVFHSSKRTILSSRVESDSLVSPTLVWRPQEVSSTPLDVASDGCPEGDEPYKVTEPDDTDISEPSKWRSSQALSEESSSVDTASLVDSSARVTVASRRTDSSKTSSASSQSIRDDEPKTFRSSFRRKPTSEPLMKISEHAKCLESSKLLTNKPKDEWHDRRNSYGFETSTLNGMKSLSEDDKIGMESSTDSGICKSNEVVNIPIKHYLTNDSDSFNKENKVSDPPESFQDWLAKNRSIKIPKHDYSSARKSIRDDGLINLKSLGKISISLPHYESSDDEKYKLDNIDKNFEEPERKLKKVGFCKTELHFAAESGVVNIIETDDKPPPNHDFRKRRSAFVPIKSEQDKPITLFSGTYSNENRNIDLEQTHYNNETVTNNDRPSNEHDNDSNVKSILKNKIPKPKPYLLGEDMDFDKGFNSMENIWSVQLRKTSDEYSNKNLTQSPISIINESLKQDNSTRSKSFHNIDHYLTTDVYVDKNAERENQSNPAEYVNRNVIPRKTQSEKSVASTQTPDDFISLYDSSKASKYEDKETITEDCNMPIGSNSSNFVNEKLKLLQLSPIMKNRAKTRELRQNELTYFGVKTDPTIKDIQIKVTLEDREEHNVKPPKRRSKIYEQPIYQNIPIRPVPVPAPRSTKELQNKILKSGQNSLEKSITNNTSDEEKKPSKTDNIRRSRVLDTIQEFKSSKDHKTRRTHREKKDALEEIIQKPVTNSSPTLSSRLTEPTRSTRKTNSRESLIPSRESSVDNVSHIKIRHRDKEKAPKPGRDSIRKSDKATTHRNKYTDKEQDNPNCQQTPIKEIDNILRSKTRSSSVDSNKKNSLRHSIERRNQSVDRQSYIDRENHNMHSVSKEKHPKSIEESYHNKSSKNRIHHLSNGDSINEKARKREYIINYDENKLNENSAARHSSSKHQSKKREKETKSQLIPKEVTRTSRVATIEMKTPMLIKESHHRTKGAIPRSSRKKHREESLQ